MIVLMEWINSHIIETIILVLAGGSTLVQIAPIQINPWSALSRWVGRAINSELINEIQLMQETMSEHIRMDDERYAKQCRMRILRFNDEILQDGRHSKEHYDEILDDVTEYERYCATHPEYKNSKACMAIANVEARYQKHLAEKSFL